MSPPISPCPSPLGHCASRLAPALGQAHCGEVEHDDDFTYDCEQVEVVLTEDDALPDGSVDLNAENVHAFYNAAAADAVTLSMRCACAPFQVDEKTYATMEEFWRAQVVDAAAEAAGREALLKRALAAQYATPAAAESGLVAHLLATADQLLVNVDVDPWLGMQAAGGISSGQNVFGKALMALRAELREQ